MKKTITLGLMSGTSLDGVDAVAVDFANATPVLLGHHHVPFSEALRSELLALCAPGENEIDRAGDASVALSRLYAQAIAELLDKADIPFTEVAAAGIHGQTIRHRPQRGWTLQLNHPALVAELSGLDVISDFRSRDVAAGGEGAPLVPAFHAKVFTGGVDRCIVNIGGISNITVLPPAESPRTVTGFDCGPGNILLDAWCLKHLGRPFDENGRWAAAGRSNHALLDLLLSEPFLAKAPPKSTGRELFSLAWLESRLAELSAMDVADVQATLVNFTARSITDAVARFAPRTKELYICGGGALNPVLMASLQHLAGSASVQSTEALGVAPMQVEGMAFAWLAWAFLHREPGNLADVTAAAGPRILGALYPH